MMQLYPEIYACIGCNACTKACSKELDVMQYIAYAQRAEYDKCAHESFSCVACGICASKCPAGISHPLVAMLARRLTGKYILPETEHNRTKSADIREGKYDDLIAQIMDMPLEDQKQLYNTREIEK
jgi:CO dehydrogenase/acetyl-CoA synthase alpha subunit